jgi:hypothetical protein
MPIPIEPEVIDENACIVELGSDDPHQLVLWLGLMDTDFDVLDAPELAAAVRELWDRYHRAAGLTRKPSSRRTLKGGWRETRMIARIWRTGLDESRADEYDAFSVEKSLPMFQRQPGLRAVFFVRTNDGRAAITLWQDLASAEALATSQDYLDTVDAILAAGFLRPPQAVELLPVDQAWLAPDLI